MTPTLLASSCGGRQRLAPPLALLLLLLLAYLPAWAQPAAQPQPIRSLRELPLPKELRLPSRPAPQAVLAPYEREASGTLTDFQGQGLAFTAAPANSWTFPGGQARTAAVTTPTGTTTYAPNQLAELVSAPIRLDTTLTNRAYALMGFMLYFDERYALETGHDIGSVYLQVEQADQSWSEWLLLSQRTGQSPGAGLRTTHLSLRDPALWHKRVRVKFSLQSDCATQYQGWTLDNVTFRQIVTTPQIRTAFVPPVPMAPIVPRIRPNDPLVPPINGIQRWLVPALQRLQQNSCRLDVTFVVNGAHFPYNAAMQDLPKLVLNNLDQLAELLQGAQQTSCKRVRVLVAGGRLGQPVGGTPATYYLAGGGLLGEPASNQHMSLRGPVALTSLKLEVQPLLASSQQQNTVPPRNGASVLLDYLQRGYGPTPEPGVKRVIVVLNNSDNFENARYASGTPVTKEALQTQLAAKGVSLIVNTPPQLSFGQTPGVLRQAATVNYQDRDPQHMLLDVAAAEVCTSQDEACQDPGLVIKLFGTSEAKDDNVTVGGTLPGQVEITNPRGELELSSPNNNLLFSTKILANGELDNPRAPLRLPLTATDRIVRFFVTPVTQNYTYDAEHNVKANVAAKIYEAATAARLASPDQSTAAATTSSGGNVVASGTQTANITNQILLFRGVNVLSNLHAEATRGRVTARGWGLVGSHASPMRHHITGTNFSIFTSWSLEYAAAAKFAVKPFFAPAGQPADQIEQGVIMQIRLDPAKTVKSPNLVLDEQEVLLIGAIQATGVQPVKRTDFFNDPTFYSLDNAGKVKAMGRLRGVFHGDQWPSMPPATTRPCLFVGEKWGDLLRNQNGITSLEAYLVSGGVETPLLNAAGVNSWSTDEKGLLCLNLNRDLAATERVKVRATYQNKRFEGTSTARHPVIYLNNNPHNLVIAHQAPAGPLRENFSAPNGPGQPMELGALVEQSEVDVYGNRFNIDPFALSPVAANLDSVQLRVDGTRVPLWVGIAPDRQNAAIDFGFYTTWRPPSNRSYVFTPRAYLKDGTVLEDHKPLNIHVGAGATSPRSTAASPLSATTGQGPANQAVVVYPNPFQDEFSVTYALPQADEVSVLLQPMDGSQALPLLPARKQAAGRQQLTLRSGGVATGLYLLIVRGKSGYEQRHKLVKMP